MCGDGDGLGAREADGGDVVVEVCSTLLREGLGERIKDAQASEILFTRQQAHHSSPGPAVRLASGPGSP